MRVLTECRLCGHSNFLPAVLDLGSIPFANGGGATPLRLVRCSDCGFVQLDRSFDPDSLFRDYWYESGISGTIRVNLAKIAAEAKNFLGREPQMVVDIGANDGTLLDHFSDVRADRRVGFEPCYRLAAISAAKGHTMVEDYFTRHRAHDAGVVQADLVFAISMFYDLDYPSLFLSEVRSILAPDGLFCIQMNYLGSMLDNAAFDNIVHEHVGYYSYRVFERLVREEGFDIMRMSLSLINGGSIRVWLRHQDYGSSALESEPLDCSPLALQRFASEVEYIRSDAQRFAAVHGDSSIHLLGASTRANTLLSYFFGDPSAVIEVCSERNPKRVGQVTATGIPIVSEEESRAQKPDYYWIGPWWASDEIMARERAAGFEGIFIRPLPSFSLLHGP